MKIKILPHVFPALLASAEWYELERAGLGAQFLREAKAAVNSLRLMPLRFPVIYRDARRTQVGRFPFGVFFVIRHGRIYVFSIVHLQRHPKQWKKNSGLHRTRTYPEEPS